jgi:hypothetical protein
VSVLGEIELKATKGMKKSENMAFDFKYLCPQSLGCHRERLTVPLPPTLLSGPNNT